MSKTRDLVNPFNPTSVKESFDRVKISIASPEKIQSWSFGEIKKPETINYRTFKPERDGLFCARIFGPVKDYECLCGKYKRMKFRGITCEKCGVEVTKSNVRRERMGHIDLATPVAHIWFLKSLPSRISTIMDMKLKEVDQVLYYEKFMVLEPGITTLAYKKLLDEQELAEAQQEFGEDNFRVGIGAEAVREILEKIDLKKEQDTLRQEIPKLKSQSVIDAAKKRLKLIEYFIDSGNKPEWMILTMVPVIPPDLRPLVPLDGGRFATSDLNDLYRRVINRNNRLKRLLLLKAPDIIIRNEKRMLQESVDALFDNGRRGRVITGTNKRPLKSLADMLKGKQGRFRQNLLGKRVDYSGRSVIVVGPELKLHQCGIPKKMALELFKPFIFSRLEALGHSSTLKQSKKMLENERPQVWDVLESVIREHPVLLNRAPTLHRLGVQAFEPILIEGRAIQLHPLVCAAFNADFDGDQMAVHVPLSLEAQLECRVLMMSTNNILNPSSGKPVIVPSQDIILGLYYLTQMKNKEKGQGMFFSSFDEINHALDNEIVSLHAKITARYNTFDSEGNEISERVETTPGRMLIAEFFPKAYHLKFELLNKVIGKKEVSQIIGIIYRYCGQKETVIFCDKLMETGFKYAHKAGISIGKDDLVIPASKQKLVEAAQDSVKEYEDQYKNGVITKVEKYNKVIDAWSNCTDKVASEMMKGISSVEKDLNPIYIMADSGARGSAAQMKQLAGMRGLMAKPTGEIIETPIISNFCEGLTVLEYFNSTHGARKGLADTALKTASSGYLTRKLCDVAQDCTVTEVDCGTKDGIEIKEVVVGGDVIENLGERILGRFTATEIKDPISGELLLKANEYVDEEHAEKVKSIDIRSVLIRSVLTCEAKRGVCVHCYGRDLARGHLVNVGEAVGMIAAQSIGEPGTQLTMRTFHIGGTASIEDKSSEVVGKDGVIKIINKNIVTNSENISIVMGRNCQLSVHDSTGREFANYNVPYGARLLIQDGQEVKKGQKICEWDPFTKPIISEKSGIANYVDLEDGKTFREEIDRGSGSSISEVIDWRVDKDKKTADKRPRITLRDKDGKVVKLSDDNEARYYLQPGAILSVNDGQKVAAGDVLARAPMESTKTKDITGGLPRVSDLFEAREPKQYAQISAANGTIKFEKDSRGKQKIAIIPEDPKEEMRSYTIQKGQTLNFREGEEVLKGDLLTDGEPWSKDILAVLGIEALAKYLVGEIQNVYRVQGVKINDKHIEVMVKQMLKKTEIIDEGDTQFLKGEQVDLSELKEENEKIAINKGTLATSKPVLQGITRASIQTGSFISAASFQETTRVLTDAAVRGRVDNLQGLKENVIVGRLVPAGTGLSMRRVRRIATEKDAKVQKEIDEQKQESLEETKEIAEVGQDSDKEQSSDTATT